MSKIDGVEVHEFTFEVENLGLETESEKAVYNIGYKPGARMTLSKYAVVIKANDGARGEYVERSYKVFTSERKIPFYEMEYFIPSEHAREAFELFAGFRQQVSPADEGASILGVIPAATEAAPAEPATA